MSVESVMVRSLAYGNAFSFCFSVKYSFIYFQGTLNVRMCWSLLGTGFTLRIMHHLNPRIFHMMIPLISHFSLILVDEGVVILHLRFVPFYFTYSLLL